MEGLSLRGSLCRHPSIRRPLKGMILVRGVLIKLEFGSVLRVQSV